MYSVYDKGLNISSMGDESCLILIAPLQARRLNVAYNLTRFILCCSFSVFDDLYFIDLVFIYLVLC